MAALNDADERRLSHIRRDAYAGAGISDEDLEWLVETTLALCRRFEAMEEALDSKKP